MSSERAFAACASEVADRKRHPGERVETDDAHGEGLMQKGKVDLDGGGLALLIVV